MVKAFVVSILVTIFSWSGVVRVATSANVSYAMDSLIEKFQASHPKTRVQKIVSSSGKLTAQIIHKAPFDIFLSANMSYPKRLFKMGISSQPKVYAKGLLAIFSKKKRDFSKGLELLKSDSIKKIAVANPKLAPYGKASIEALKSAKIYSQVKPKVIFGDSISQTLSYALKIADIGIVAKSLLLSPKMSKFKEGKNWQEVDKNLYTPIKQGAVLINPSKEAKAFFDFLFSKDAKEILSNYGYLVD